MKNLRELATAGANGVAATAVDMGTLVLLVGRFHVAVALAAFLACCAGAVVNFMLNKFVAFRDRSRITWWQVARFGLVAVAAAMLTAACMELVSVKLGVPVPLAKAICAAVVFVAWTYPAQRRLVFAPIGATS